MRPFFLRRGGELDGQPKDTWCFRILLLEKNIFQIPRFLV